MLPTVSRLKHLSVSTGLLLLFMSGVQVFCSPPESLKLVNVLYRHGDRSPEFIYPKDIHQVPGAWPDGLGWLSNIGKMQQYELGQLIQSRYNGFLNTTYYHHEEISIQSSSVERCLMSAYSNLAGLFPPQGDQVWNADLPWQPIPVHSVPQDIDNKLALSAPCPRYYELLNKEYQSPAVKKEEKDNKEFYEKVANATGVKKESIRDIWEIADTLLCEKAHNLTWNAWAQEPGVYEKLMVLKNFGFGLMYNGTEMSKLKGGPLLKEVIANMKNASTQSAPSPKFFMYSAHDTTVAAFLSAMKLFDRHQPMYRALVMVELHLIKDKYIVKIFYRNDTEHEPYELLPPGCEDPCTLETFEAVTKDRIPVDWHAECYNSTQSTTALSPASWIALAIGSTLCVIIFVTVAVLVIRLRRRRNLLYNQM